MHELVGIFVEADDEKGAIAAAEEVLDNLIGDDGPFDYYDVIGSANGRHNDAWAEEGATGPLRLGTPKGRALAEEIWGSMVGEFTQSLKEIRAGLAGLSDEDLISGAVRKEGSGAAGKEGFSSSAEGVRHLMNRVGQYRGSSIQLYGEGGSGVRTRADLNYYLEDPDRWIVPADVHY